MAMRKSATQFCSLINHLEQDIEELWIVFSSRLLLVAQIGSLVTSLHECNKEDQWRMWKNSFMARKNAETTNFCSFAL